MESESGYWVWSGIGCRLIGKRCRETAEGLWPSDMMERLDGTVCGPVSRLEQQPAPIALVWWALSLGGCSIPATGEAPAGGLASAMAAPADRGACAVCCCAAVAELYGFPVCQWHQQHGESEGLCPTCKA